MRISLTRFGLVGRWGRWLSGQEQYGQQGPGDGNASGDEGADGEAAEERVGGGVMQRQWALMLAASQLRR